MIHKNQTNLTFVISHRMGAKASNDKLLNARLIMYIFCSENTTNGAKCRLVEYLTRDTSDWMTIMMYI